MRAACASRPMPGIWAGSRTTWMTFSVEDSDGKVIASGQDLDALR